MKFQITSVFALVGLTSVTQVQARLGSVSTTMSRQLDHEVSGSALYVMTNRVTGVGNSVVVYDRDTVNGTLSRVGLFDTGGMGGLGDGGAGFPGGFPNSAFGTPNDALASQNSLLLSENNHCLFASNPGSDTVTTFAVENEGRCLNRVGIYPSGGNFPVSVTQHGDLVYVLNAGGSAAISGFRFDEELCTLDPIANSTRSMDNANTNPPFFLLAPAQASITPDGRGIVATLKGKNTIHYWSLTNEGTPAEEQVISPSNGFTPFSFTFDDNGHLLVSEAFGVAPFAPPPPTENNGAVSSYSINEDGSLELISGSVPTGQTATCWIRYFNGYAYTTNNEPPNPSVSIFSVDEATGALDLVESVAANGEQGIDRPIDFGLTNDGSFLYALSTGSIEADGAGRPQISVFSNHGDSLELIEIVDQGLPLSTTAPAFEATQGVFGLAIL